MSKNSSWTGHHNTYKSKVAFVEVAIYGETLLSAHESKYLMDLVLHDLLCQLAQPHEPPK